MPGGGSLPECKGMLLTRDTLQVAFVPQEVHIMASRWQNKADRTLMNALAQNTDPSSDTTIQMAFVPQEVHIMDSRWQNKAEHR
jgi:hypothetical protein